MCNYVTLIRFAAILSLANWWNFANIFVIEADEDFDGRKDLFVSLSVKRNHYYQKIVLSSMFYQKKLEANARKTNNISFNKEHENLLSRRYI